MEGQKDQKNLPKPKVCCPFAENWCRSKSELIKCDFEWTLENFAHQDFDLQLPNTNQIVSTDFSVDSFPDIKWHLAIYTEKKRDFQGLNSNFTGFKLCSKEARTQPSLLQVEFAFLNEQREKVIKNELKFPILANKYCNLIMYEIATPEISSTWPFSQKGHLTIFCEIQTMSNQVITSGKEMCKLSADQFQPFLQSREVFLTAFQDLFENKNLSDVTLKIQDSSFPAHKAILAARSPVFAAMFNHELKEKLANEVEISNFKPEVFKEIIRYIYTCKVPPKKMVEFAPEILAAADAYYLSDLKDECEKHLGYRLSADNCIEFLLLADLHSAELLKKKALDFFRRHPVEVFTSDGWMKAKLNESEVLCEMMRSVFNPTNESS